jgi:hypothetical protein
MTRAAPTTSPNHLAQRIKLRFGNQCPRRAQIIFVE